MNVNTDSTKLTTELLFTLDVRIPDQSPRKIEVQDRILAGIDPRNDLILVDSKIKTKHFLFRKMNNILSVHYMGANGDTFLNGHELIKGKLYILEKGDILKVGKIEIIIRRETSISKSVGSSKPESTVVRRMDDFLDEALKEMAETKDLPSATAHASKNEDSEESNEAPEKTQTKFKKVKTKTVPILNQKVNANVKEPLFDFRTINLIPVKFYGFIVDVALTYLLLGFVLPSLDVMGEVLNFQYPLSTFIAETITKNSPEFPVLKLMSVLEFFICFHSLMIASSLLLGSTPGALLAGVHYKGKSNLFAKRFKAYIYALINIAALPLLIFDFPIYKGRTIKEVLTLSAHELNTSTLFKIMRRAVLPLFIIASFLSPFFLAPPFTAVFTEEKMPKQKRLDPHTAYITSYSKHFGIGLNSEINKDFAILPSFEQKKLGIVLYDLKNKKALMMKEARRTSLDFAFYQLRYANPLASLMIPANQIPNEAAKNWTLQSLNLTLESLVQGIENFGPFLANGFLFKENFIKNFQATDNFTYNFYDPKNPTLKISAGSKIRSEERVFLFTRKDIIEFSVTVPRKSQLLEHLTKSLLAPMRFDQSSTKALPAPQILEVLEAFERSNYQTLLTYYINEAKKAEDYQNPEWQEFIKKNIEQTKRALFSDMTRTGLTKTIEQSFDDVIKSLAPTEKQ